jgi:adenylate cyclase class IV
MARNVEIKARLQHLEAMVPRVASIADDGPVPIEQDDTFFGCATGRLKLRAFAAGDGELIFYRRADTAGPKTSFHLRTPTQDPDGLRDALASALGIVGRVRKRRTLFLVGRTRIHLDRVEGLGDFLELEVVLGDDEPAEAGVAIAQALMDRLGVDAASLVATAYVDLLGGVSRG